MGGGTGLIQTKRTIVVNGTEHPLKRIWEHGFVLSTCVGRETDFASKWEMSVLRADMPGFFICLFFFTWPAGGIYLALLCTGGCVGFCSSLAFLFIVVKQILAFIIPDHLYMPDTVLNTCHPPKEPEK